MNNAQKLAYISTKVNRRIIGLMSGTSLDGLDIACVNFIGYGFDTKISDIRFVTIPYSEEEKDKIRKIFTKSKVDLQYLTVLNEWIGRLHGQMINRAIADWGMLNSDVDLIASHGQTIFHAPQHLHQYAEFDFNATLQIGDGDHVAVTTGIITLADFRQKHVAYGGEGAPLALYGDSLILASKSVQRVLLNLGGISNYTFLPISGDHKKAYASDIGPGNTLIDMLVQKHLNISYDPDGRYAASGSCNDKLLEAMLGDAFLAQPYPKSTGQEYFNEAWVDVKKLEAKCEDISLIDLLCTVTHLTAHTIANCVKAISAVEGKLELYLSGGGSQNKFLVSLFEQLIPNTRLGFTDELGINYDAKEAILFAILANECIANPNPNYPALSEYGAITMGKVCFAR